MEGFKNANKPNSMTSHLTSLLTLLHFCKITYAMLLQAWWLQLTVFPPAIRLGENCRGMPGYTCTSQRTQNTSSITKLRTYPDKCILKPSIEPAGVKWLCRLPAGSSHQPSSRSYASPRFGSIRSRQTCKRWRTQLRPSTRPSTASSKSAMLASCTRWGSRGLSQTLV